MYFIHPSGKVKLSFDRTRKNISQLYIYFIYVVEIFQFIIKMVIYVIIRDTETEAEVATGVEDFYFREQIQTVIKSRFYPRLCQFLMKIIRH